MMVLTKQEIYDLAVTNETDLYNTETGYYISGSIIDEDEEEREELVVYLLCEGEADELVELTKQYNEKCWIGYLGIGGIVYYDPWEWISSDSCTETGWVKCSEYEGR